ncbi:filamentous hemagglutinin N-terminal domain-containing protein [Utexia brackfieldae]|uniref:two-partner secretion domain-containing protein n=1 Tax=Utexia brackfieldae TaxID=3074108 RepID=UPI00370D7051
MNNKTKKNYHIFNSIVISILFSSGLAHADVVMKNGSTTTTKNVQVVNINRANSYGLSHNIYSKFQVEKQGIILNNSPKGANTTLAGQISGNANLSNGSAKVILNEVQGSRGSSLAGMVEVAGNKASVIIADPSGVSCYGCGFINTDNVTLTAGKPDVVNGKLKGYTVNQGQITIGEIGGGLNSDSPTALLGRNVFVKGKVTAKNITVIAGNNYIDANNTVVRTVSGPYRLANDTYSIDISELGGMYANKIMLVNTEELAGVTNKGTIVADNLGLQIDTQGSFDNRGTINTQGTINIKSGYWFLNKGGQIISNQDINIDTTRGKPNMSVPGSLVSGPKVGVFTNSNNGQIKASSDLNINSADVDNQSGSITGLGHLNINTNNNLLRNSGQLITNGLNGGNIVLNTNYLKNTGGLIQGFTITAHATTIDNTNGIINAGQNVDITTTGDILNRNGLIRSQLGSVKLVTTNGLIDNMSTKQTGTDLNRPNVTGIVVANSNGNIDITTNRLYNAAGQVMSLGGLNIKASKEVSNTNGKISAGKKLSIKTDTLGNSQGGTITANGGINLDIQNGGSIVIN